MVDYIGIAISLLFDGAIIAGVVMAVKGHKRSKFSNRPDTQIRNMAIDEHLPGIANIVEGSNRAFFDRFDQTKIAEDKTTSWLASLGPSYVIFTNLIIPNGVDGDTTEIDHIVVSQYGIFCVETKSHHGNIYGYKDSKNWKQYIGPEEHTIHSPLRQNYKHVRALEKLLNHNLKSKIHSYVVFPNVHILKVDSGMVCKSVQHVVDKIAVHSTTYYTLDELKEILRILAIYSSAHDTLRPIHIDNVHRVIAAK